MCPFWNAQDFVLVEASAADRRIRFIGVHCRFAWLVHGARSHCSGSLFIGHQLHELVSTEHDDSVELLPAKLVPAASCALVTGVDCLAANALVLGSLVCGKPVQQLQWGLRVVGGARRIHPDGAGPHGANHGAIIVVVLVCVGTASRGVCWLQHQTDARDHHAGHHVQLCGDACV